MERKQPKNAGSAEWTVLLRRTNHRLFEGFR